MSWGARVAMASATRAGLSDSVSVVIIREICRANAGELGDVGQPQVRGNSCSLSFR